MFGSRSTFMRERETKPRITRAQMNMSIARGRVMAKRVSPIAAPPYLPGDVIAGPAAAGRSSASSGLRHGRRVLGLCVGARRRGGSGLGGRAASGLARRAAASGLTAAGAGLTAATDPDRVAVVDGRLPGDDHLVARLDAGRDLDVLFVGEPGRHVDLLGAAVLYDEDDRFAAALYQRV